MTGTNPTQTFLLEAEELLSTIEAVVLDMGAGAPAADGVNQLFRAFHTLKGSGAMFDFDDVAEFTHHVEGALDAVREGRVAISAPLLSCVLAARDLVRAMLHAHDGGPAVETATRTTILRTLTELTGVVAAHPPVNARHGAAMSTESPRRWHITFRPDPAFLRRGANPHALLEELRALGTCRVRAHTDRVPSFADLAPELCHVRWEIELDTAASENTIRDVFVFVEDGSDLVIRPLAPQAETADPGPARVSASGPTAAAPQPGTEDGGRPPAANATGASAKTAKDTTVRVTCEKLDRLVNLVGELVMNQSRLQQIARKLGVAELTHSAEQIERLIDELRDDVLSIRMMPIGSTFGRFRRLVHDLSAELGKEVDLATEGAETEVDKTVLDQLSEPLVHLIRNSLDHGIEPAERRLASGKPRRGTIRLSASHTGSSVVIRVEDDGKGLDRDAILAKAAAKGLVEKDAQLSDRDVLSLVFLPGFSTAERVTNVSGRGVGMDVVKRQIEGLRGTVTLASTPGHGTTVTCTLPLTLAIVDGLVVAVDEDQFVIPTAAVLENVELPKTERDAFNGRQVVAVRGELIPYIRLRGMCGMAENGPSIEKIVIVRHGDERVGIVVDRVLGSHQTVVQALGRFYRDIAMLSGSTIMGDGRVALIIDVAGLVRDEARARGRTLLRA